MNWWIQGPFIFKQTHIASCSQQYDRVLSQNKGAISLHFLWHVCHDVYRVTPHATGQEVCLSSRPNQWWHLGQPQPSHRSPKWHPPNGNLSYHVWPNLKLRENGNPLAPLLFFPALRHGAMDAPVPKPRHGALALHPADSCQPHPIVDLQWDCQDWIGELSNLLFFKFFNKIEIPLVWIRTLLV